MNIELIVVGKTDMKEVEALVAMYTKRLNHYVRFAITTIADVRNTKKMSEAEQKRLEGEAILRLVSDSDHLMLLDEHGAELRSIEFAEQLQRRMSSGVKRLVFVIGGPYGFSDAVYGRANSKLSLSRMTYSHQLVRAIFTEQLYRAFTILKNEPYHHE
ncbi:MAG: 23S rRNA (pseudouridine(1915)-N(3))-methyltransferase RlmH [Alistipes sp.]|jgi:23S rRNA (pseudouridine1915-N3)-methyltransferase|nr:23S rRNA (pseudouridine(1915)-N(3))-methyltransferase RlmH [Alistipes sp.]MBR5197261.1 23S rRNA (pseudouridine(1915)-N(3))-methyltransferase RlmH [Alistipes sp.]MBR5585394.1 23S rRNA (pseudouridine(1915)-N(3))-methyltransferase RlmH [Alistipes sp.]MBR6544985.1 23S rRNA (pseudouridine(1915)-N(3))-methyltransferase RlmH [Alistipes sp.]